MAKLTVKNLNREFLLYFCAMSGMLVAHLVDAFGLPWYYSIIGVIAGCASFIGFTKLLRRWYEPVAHIRHVKAVHYSAVQGLIRDAVYNELMVADVTKPLNLMADRIATDVVEIIRREM